MTTRPTRLLTHSAVSASNMLVTGSGTSTSDAGGFDVQTRELHIGAAGQPSRSPIASGATPPQHVAMTVRRAA